MQTHTSTVVQEGGRGGTPLYSFFFFFFSISKTFYFQWKAFNHLDKNEVYFLACGLLWAAGGP